MAKTIGSFSVIRWMCICVILLMSGGWFRLGNASQQGEIIGKWAETLGDELWELGQKVTKAPEIKARYKALNARVEFKDGDSLMDSIVENVSRMLLRKMEAVKCILNIAETISEQFEPNNTDQNFTYYSAKYSQIEGRPEMGLPDGVSANEALYRQMSLNPDTHFYNISVNTSYSAVHVPTNVYDRGLSVFEAIQWSEALDEVFVQNYNADPALSWQYFGTSTGMMRQYPAMEWKEGQVDRPVDLFDCRSRSWYIEAATCSKDVVILLDNSGSMYGFRNYIARLTVKSILDTFSNNDFVNIYNFSKGIDEVVPCFKDMLVQATPENIRIFNEAIAEIVPEGNANVSRAFTKAFELLEYYRIKRGCNSTEGCNQAIMLITDGVPGNITEVFEKYNWFDNGTRIPVRVFTYLIGREVTKVKEIQLMACMNRGYYVHITSMNAVQQQVIKYIQVIARPLVLQNEDHPVTWTHAYADITDPKISPWLREIKTVKSSDTKLKKYFTHDIMDKFYIRIQSKHSDENKDDILYEEYRLLTSVAIPAYDRKSNRDNITRTANLLGVAGTDVPIVDIDKLTLPYKLGVNGYSFVISNNGYLLLHPDLRPVYKGVLKENYNSIDFTEIEMMDDDREARDLGSDILKLRDSLVLHKDGKTLNLSMKFHYDDIRRVFTEQKDFYYAPLPNTPFSLGLVLPQDYGNTWIKVGDEIKRNQHLGVNISEFFLGDNWKVHPEWVYCKYHYLEGHEFQTPEEELQHFLIKLNLPDWRWTQQYDPEEGQARGVPEWNGLDDDEEPELNCGRKTHADDDYYCNKELVQLVVFDAKVTDPSYKSWQFKDEAEEALFLKFNASLRFVATMSGLTRWQFIFGEDTNDTDSEFGDYHTRAIDETWYRSAVLQHSIDQDSFVFSVPLETDEVKEDDRDDTGSFVVTASHAIFPRDGGLEAPASVVGFQFSHSLLYDRFMEITSNVDCDDCLKSCASEEQDCYVIDHNGYVVISETLNDTGRFFGEVEGAIMESMVEAKIYEKIVVFDLQGLCFRDVMISSDGEMHRLNPIKYVMMGVQWMIARMMWIAIEAVIWVESVAIDLDYDTYDDDLDVPTPAPRKLRKGQNQEEEEFFSRPVVPKWERQPYSCDLQSDLYLLQQEMFIKGDGYMSEAPRNCSRPFYVKRIPHSNLLLVVVNTMYPSCYRKLSATPYPVPYGNSTDPACHKLGLNSLSRRRLSGCYTDHPLELEIEACGLSNRNLANIFLLVISWIIAGVLSAPHSRN